MPMAPSWFNFTPGFRWFDSDGEICVLLGWEPEGSQTTDNRSSTTIDGHTHFFVEVRYVNRMTYATWHKNSWIMRDLNEETFQGATECPDDHPILARLMTKNTTKYMDKERS